MRQPIVYVSARPMMMVITPEMRTAMTLSSVCAPRDHGVGESSLVSLRRSTGPFTKPSAVPRVRGHGAVGAAGRVGEQADQDGTDDATDQVDADHVERVVPAR